MKLLFNILFCTLLFNSCIAQKHTEVSLNYEAFTRGSFVKIDVNSKEFVFKNFEEKKKYELSAKNWMEIQLEIEKIKLDDMENLKAPSTKSHRDAALIASLKIMKDGKTYQSSSFDHGNPPIELKALIDKLFEIAQK